MNQRSHRRFFVAIGLVSLVGLATSSAAFAAFTFTKTDFPLDSGPTDIEIANIDNANGNDVVAATNASGGAGARLVRLVNQGGGVFGSPASSDSCGGGFDVIVHNFNPSQDANPDALVSCGFMLGDGAGGFAAATATGTGYLSQATTLAELTASGNPEVVFGGPGPSGNEHSLCFASWNSPDLSNATCGAPSTFPRFPDPFLTAVPLVNEPAGDAPRDEILTASTTSENEFTAFGRNPGNNYFDWTTSNRTTSAGAIRDIAGGDVNGDAHPDILVEHAIDANPRFDTFLWDPGTGVLPSSPPLQTATIMRPERIEIADFDGDGKADVALANGIGELAVHRGNGDGTFGAAEIFAIPGTNSNVQLAVGDLSGDGMPDIVTGERHDSGTVGSLSVLINGNSPPNKDTKPPQTKIVKEPANKTSKAKAKYKFKSNEPNSTFECKLDKKKLKSCKSPAKYKVDDGKHKFSVQATDAAGNTDPSPAKDKFKVVDD